MMKDREKLEKYFMALWVVLLFVFWYLATTVFSVSPLILPKLSSVWATLKDSIINGELLYQTYYSLKIIVTGLFFSVLIALFFSLLSERCLILSSLGKVLTLLGHPLPALALLPLIIVWFGTGDLSIIVIIIHSALWPIMINLEEGFSEVKPVYLEVGKNLGLSNMEMTLEIRLKSAFGYLLAGLKIAFARSWRALIGAEMVFGAIGDKGGIGWYIFKQRTFMNTSGLFVGILVVVVIGILVETVLFRWLEKITVRKWGK